MKDLWTLFNTGKIRVVTGDLKDFEQNSKEKKVKSLFFSYMRSIL